MAEKNGGRCGYVKRNRKIDPAVMFWILVLGFGAGVQRTIATLRRAYETASAESIVPSAFYDRFSKGLIDFLKECLAHGVADLISHTSLSLSEKLKGFEDLPAWPRCPDWTGRDRHSPFRFSPRGSSWKVSPSGCWHRVFPRREGQSLL